MTIINPNSIAGITSVTAEAGVMNFYKSDGTLAGLQLNGVNFNTTSGISTFNNVYVGGTITYEDVKNVDSVGIITARTGVRITGGGLNVVGVTTIAHAEVSTAQFTGSYVNVDGNLDIADSIRHLGDSNTKIRFPANDTITAETAGSERLRIDSSGRVLIGTTTEGNESADELTVASSGNTGITIRSGTSSNASIFFTDATSGADEYRGFIQYVQSDDVLKFGTATSERLRIQSTGIVKVETSDSSSFNAHFLVNNSESNSGVSLIGSGSSFSAGGWAAVTDAGIIRSSANSSNGLVLQAASGDMRFYVGGNPPAERLRITSAGKVGISEDDPQAQLHINSGANSAIMFGNTTNGYKIRANVTSSHDYGLLIEDEDGVDLYRAVASTGTSNANTHTFFTGGSERLRITSGGQTLFTGVSGTTPLDIKTSNSSNNTVQPIIEAYADNATYKARIGLVREGSSGLLGWAFLTNAVGSPTEKLRITSGGELVFAGDTDTFIDHPNANQIEITAGNIEVATFIDGQSNKPAMLIDKGGVNNTTAGANYNSNANANDLVVGNVSSGNHGITVCSVSSGTGYINFSDGSGGGADAYRGSISYEHANALTVVRAKTGNVVLRNDGTDTLVATSTGQLQATGAADVRLTLGSSGTAGTNNSVHIRADSADLKFMAASGGSTLFETNGEEQFKLDSTGTRVCRRGVSFPNPNNTGSEITAAVFKLGSDNIQIQEKYPNGAYADRCDIVIRTNSGYGAGQSDKIRLTAGGNIYLAGRQYLGRSGVAPMDARGNLRETFFQAIAASGSHTFQIPNSYGGGLVYVVGSRYANANIQTTKIYAIAIRTTANAHLSSAIESVNGQSGSFSFTVTGASKGITVTNNDSTYSCNCFVTFDVTGFLG